MKIHIGREQERKNCLPIIIGAYEESARPPRPCPSPSTTLSPKQYIPSITSLFPTFLPAMNSLEILRKAEWLLQRAQGQEAPSVDAIDLTEARVATQVASGSSRHAFGKDIPGVL